MNIFSCLRAGRDLAEWLEHMFNGPCGSIPASSDTLESEGRQMKQMLKKVTKQKDKKKTLKILLFRPHSGP
jgi:hypothetical protein